MGRCRGSAWKGEKCWACGDENGGVLHFATRCEDREVVEMRRRVLRRVEDELVEDERERWNKLEEGEQVWVTLGKMVNGEVQCSPASGCSGVCSRCSDSCSRCSSCCRFAFLRGFF